MQTRLSRARTEGFTLIELLVVVLIIGILAAIALPNFVGQRTKAKNAAALSSVRNAYLAAKSYYTESETYAGLTAAILSARESSITGAATVTTPGSTADPTKVALYEATTFTSAATGPTVVSAATTLTTGTLIICTVSKGDTVYCIADNGTLTSYGKLVGALGITGTAFTVNPTWSASSF